MPSLQSKLWKNETDTRLIFKEEDMPNKLLSGLEEAEERLVAVLEIIKEEQNSLNFKFY